MSEEIRDVDEVLAAPFAGSAGVQAGSRWSGTSPVSRPELAEDRLGDDAAADRRRALPPPPISASLRHVEPQRTWPSRNPPSARAGRRLIRARDSWPVAACRTAVGAPGPISARAPATAWPVGNARACSHEGGCADREALAGCPGSLRGMSAWSVPLVRPSRPAAAARWRVDLAGQRVSAGIGAAWRVEQAGPTRPASCPAAVARRPSMNVGLDLPVNWKSSSNGEGRPCCPEPPEVAVPVVGAPHHAVPEAEGRHRVLERHEGTSPPPAKSGVRVREHASTRPHDSMIVVEELVDDQPLVGPPDQTALGLGRRPRRRRDGAGPLALRPSRTTSLWKRRNARCSWATTRFSSLRPSPMQRGLRRCPAADHGQVGRRWDGAGSGAPLRASARAEDEALSRPDRGTASASVDRRARRRTANRG